MTYATVCSGIGAPEVAWKDLWGTPVFTSEIEAFPSAVLKHHMPDVPNYGDMTKYKEWPDHGQLGLICGGTPCQSFSVAGLRKGMDDPRGNLTLTFLGLLARYNPRWFVWENVPGVFSSISGERSDFGIFLAALAELGYSCAYRVLDAQHFGVPQRRRRVFVVGHLGTDWRPPFAVLFEPESLRGNIAPSKKEGQRVAALPANGVGTCGADDNQAQAGHLIQAVGRSKYKKADTVSAIRACVSKQADVDLITVYARQDPIIENGIALPLDTKGNTQAVAIRTAQTNANGHGISEGVSHTLDGAQGQAIAFTQNQCGDVLTGKVMPSMGTNQNATGRNTPKVHTGSIVRRLTPLECERLQGFPDGYTLIPGKYKFKAEAHEAILQFIMRHFNMNRDEAVSLAGNPDGPRYKALGNSMAVPVVKWIGRRIQLWESVNAST